MPNPEKFQPKTDRKTRRRPAPEGWGAIASGKIGSNFCTDPKHACAGRASDLPRISLRGLQGQIQRIQFSLPNRPH